MSEQFDVVVIGGGPGGYVAAIRAAQLGLKTACVDAFIGKDGKPALGGTCLNIGCIPSKALLDSSRQFHNLTHSFKDHGISADNAKIDVGAMIARKDKIVKQFTGGINVLFKGNKANPVTPIAGFATLHPGNVVKIKGHDGNVAEIRAKHVILAAGSKPIELPFAKFDNVHILDNAGALDVAAVPKRLGVIGAGVIGLELGSVWQRLGAEVTVVEFLDRIIPGTDNEITKAFERVLTKQGLKFRLGMKVTKAVTGNDGVTLTMEPSKGGPAEELKADVVLLSIGRRAYTEGLGLADVGVETDERGRVRTDAHFATNVPGIYAIGDVIAGPMLAHKGEDEGVALAEILAGQAGHVNYDTIPSIIYTWPELATLGQNEEQLKAAGVAYNVGKFPFMANGRARAMGDTDGFVKILADKKTDRVLGAHILGPDAGTLIAELVTAMEFGASAEDVARICHAHPTLSESVKEAALAVEGRALHI
jgi:dihydrolipoamide dehydrogenase